MNEHGDGLSPEQLRQMENNRRALRGEPPLTFNLTQKAKHPKTAKQERVAQINKDKAERRKRKEKRHGGGRHG
jgi:hypothetical protein